MALQLENIVDIIEVMENYIERERPPVEIRDQLDLAYRIDDQSVILYDIRPLFLMPGEEPLDPEDTILNIEYAKATWLKTTKKWKLFWMRSSGKWEGYQPVPEVTELRDFLKIVDEDQRGCFKG